MCIRDSGTADPHGIRNKGDQRCDFQSVEPHDHAGSYAAFDYHRGRERRTLTVSYTHLEERVQEAFEKGYITRDEIALCAKRILTMILRMD